MKRVILHIGTPKTGSTSLQEFFVENNDYFKDKGYLYYIPETTFTPWGTFSNGHFLLADTLYKLQKNKIDEKHQYLNDNPSLNIFEDELDDKIDFLNEEKQHFIESCKDYDTIILSEEVIWHYCLFFNGYWQTMKDYLSECLGNDCIIDIIIYLRRQDEWFLSKWKEDMRNLIGFPYDYFEALNLYEKIGYLDYYEQVKEIEKVFDIKHIIIRNYERNCLINNNIIDDFVYHTNIDCDFTNLNKKNINQSISIECANALCLINKLLFNKKKKYLYCGISTYLSKKHPKNTHVMNIEERKKLVNKYDEGNKKIENEFLNDKELFNDNYDDKMIVKKNIFRDSFLALTIIFLVEMRKLKRRINENRNTGRWIRN